MVLCTELHYMAMYNGWTACNKLSNKHVKMTELYPLWQSSTLQHLMNCNHYTQWSIDKLAICVSQPSLPAPCNSSLLQLPPSVAAQSSLVHLTTVTVTATATIKKLWLFSWNRPKSIWGKVFVSLDLFHRFNHRSTVPRHLNRSESVAV